MDLVGIGMFKLYHTDLVMLFSMHKNLSLQYVTDLSNPFCSEPKHWLIFTYTGHRLLMH
jgi:hypothetical protein